MLPPSARTISTPTVGASVSLKIAQAVHSRLAELPQLPAPPTSLTTFLSQPRTMQAMPTPALLDTWMQGLSRPQQQEIVTWLRALPARAESLAGAPQKAVEPQLSQAAKDVSVTLLSRLAQAVDQALRQQKLPTASVAPKHRAASIHSPLPTVLSEAWLVLPPARRQQLAATAVALWLQGRPKVNTNLAIPPPKSGETLASVVQRVLIPELERQVKTELRQPEHQPWLQLLHSDSSREQAVTLLWNLLLPKIAQSVDKALSAAADELPKANGQGHLWPVYLPFFSGSLSWAQPDIHWWGNWKIWTGVVVCLLLTVAMIQY